jgi:glycine/D-amino acid oxidase-like deaminating enzyme/nitrite reductase/ring-hydroxylating ferredoxin subunit
MNSLAERTRPLWVAGEAAKDLDAAPLGENIEADIVVVGAGIAGMSTAYELARAGKRVAVLDAGPLGGGMTGRTTAHLANALDDRWYELIDLRGEEDARLAADAHTTAVDRIEAIQRAEGIDCDFVRLDGYLFLAPGDGPQILDRELTASKKVGLVGVERVERMPLDIDSSPALRFPRQGRFHPLKYLSGLARCIRRDGGRLFANSPVVTIQGGADAYVETASGHRARARESIVIATNSPVNDRVVTHTKQAPYRTFVITARVPKGSIPDSLYWDTPDPYHYVRLQPQEDGEHDFLIIGGEDHKTGQANDGDERFARLEQWARKRFPGMQDIVHRWSGQVMESVDFLAYIGRNEFDADNVYIATGDSGMGMTHGAIAGMLLSDLILGKENRWARLFDPRRTTPRAITDFVTENLNVAGQYVDYLTPGDVSSADQLKPGEGAVIRKGLRKIAAYRDESGVLHERSAICPHMGCVVRWNSTEGCFDCPCHGSQFAGDGTVVNGPSRADLAALTSGGDQTQE